MPFVLVCEFTAELLWEVKNHHGVCLLNILQARLNAPPA